MSSNALRWARLLPLIVAAAPLVAQGVSTQLAGRVLNREGGAVAAATVVIRSTETGFVRTVQTDENGRYVAPLLPVGAYSVTVSKAGFQTASNIRLNLSLGDSAPLVVRLAPETGAVVEVIATSAQVDTERATSATLLQTEELKELPLIGRRWDNFAYLTPMVSTSSRGDLAIAGQRGVNTTTTVDGAGYNSSFFAGTLGNEAGGTPYTMSVEAIREFQVITDGASAEFGRMGGGYLNAITKSGTNDFSGSLFFYERPHGLVADSHLTGKPVDDFTNRQYGFSVGGPIIADKLFYFVSGDFQRDSRPVVQVWGDGPTNPVTLNASNPADAVLLARGGDYASKRDADTLFARLDWILNVDHSLQFRVNRSEFTGDNGTGYSVAYDSTSLEEGKTLSLVAQWNWLINSNWLSEFRANYLKEELPRTRRSDHPQVNISRVGRYGESLYNRAFESTDLQFSEILTYSTPVLQVRGGVDVTFHDVMETFTPYGGGSYYFRNLNDFRGGNWGDYTQFFSLIPGMSTAEAGTMDEQEKELAAFVQADWRPNSQWKIGLGLRWDRQEHPDFGIADFTGNAVAYTRPGALTGRIPTNNAISPRLSFSWTPAVDHGRTVVRGSMGSYVSRSPSVFLYQVFTSNGQRAAQIRVPSGSLAAVAAVYPSFVRGNSFNWSNPFQLPEDAFTSNPTVFSGAPPLVQTFDPDFKNPETRRVHLEVERAFGKGWTLGLKTTYAKTKNLERITDLNLAYLGTNAYGRRMYNNTLGLNWNNWSYVGDPIRPNTSYSGMQVYVSDAESKYQAGTFTVRYQESDSPFTGQVAYTYARERDNDSNERSFSGFNAQDPNRLEDEWSWSNNDRRHVVSGYMTFREKWLTNLVASFVFRYESGLPYNPTYSVDINGDGQRNSDRLLGVERNAYREGSRKNVDLKLSRDLRFSKRYALNLSVEVSNLFNQTARYNRLNSVTARQLTPSGVSPVRYANPDDNPTLGYTLWTLSQERRVQLGARFSF